MFEKYENNESVVMTNQNKVILKYSKESSDSFFIDESYGLKTAKKKKFVDANSIIEILDAGIVKGEPIVLVSRRTKHGVKETMLKIEIYLSGLPFDTSSCTSLGHIKL